MASKTKKTVTPSKDMQAPEKFSSPLDMQEHEVNKAPDLDMQMTVEQMDAMQTKYRNEMLCGVVLGDRQVPGPAPVGDWREGFEKEYGWIAPNNVIGFYRAILQELYRMRVDK